MRQLLLSISLIYLVHCTFILVILGDLCNRIIRVHRGGCRFRFLLVFLIGLLGMVSRRIFRRCCCCLRGVGLSFASF